MAVLAVWAVITKFISIRKLYKGTAVVQGCLVYHGQLQNSANSTAIAQWASPFTVLE
jgi:hypothetical protein